MAVGSGDKLARGSAKAQFPPAGGSVTQDKWNSIFEDFDAEKYRSGDSSVAPNRDVSVDSGETKLDEGSEPIPPPVLVGLR